MNLKQPAKKAIVTLTMAGVVGLSAFGANHAVLPLQQAEAATAASAEDYAAEHALKTLNSFYKPALKGQFPGAVSGLTIGKSTKQDVYKAIGEPSVPGKDADAFDVYGANMGNPGYAFSYKLNKIREMRYFGTNVERQTNIGGITMKMLKKNWFAPDATTTFKNGKTKQTKLTYHRGEYKLEFIFNSSTELDHINLLKK
ncbi:YjgB family protein [Paenibacillus sp. BR1-192]|uniref:YjgB family protein n=1 Tax=Paenibacillus sp. BR1-192 TaxID=3032287 RepID=UPI00240E063E|nr:YjgB family protein [Paenibacillus sp. BR1-192]WFB60999.1 YjgB family protein [Paenibacillus sp. BR1-192]